MAENKKTVLAIDDNPQQLQEFKLFLVPKYDLRVVKSASEAIHFLNENTVDVILLDILMPNIDGFEFLSDIRKISGYTAVPVIIVSGDAEEGFQDRARNSGAADILSKPVQQDKLIISIEKALSAGT